MPDANPPLRFLALGDSYTIGEGVAVGASWPEQVAARLRAQGFCLAPLQVLAKTGWTTDELAAAMDGACLIAPYDLVSLAIGVNNQYRGRPLAEYSTQFGALLERAIGLAGHDAGRVMVLSIPDWSLTPFAASSGRSISGIATEIDAYNRSAAAICARHGVAIVDVTSISRDPGAQPAMLAADGLHPSAAQYALWADKVLSLAVRRLSD